MQAAVPCVEATPGGRSEAAPSIWTMPTIWAVKPHALPGLEAPFTAGALCPISAMHHRRCPQPQQPRGGGPWQCCCQTKGLKGLTCRDLWDHWYG